MKIFYSPRGLISRALAAGVFASLCSVAYAESGCPGGTCSTPDAKSAVSATSKTNPVAKAQLWVAPRDVSLRELLSQWAAAEGWQEPVWKLKPEEDFTLGASFEHTGELVEALPALFDAFPTELNLHVRTYAANRLIVVEQTHE